MGGNRRLPTRDRLRKNPSCNDRSHGLVDRGDRKLNPLSQVLSCQRRSTAALLPIGVKWCQISVADQFASSRPSAK
jgi:hypothetical protein